MNVFQPSNSLRSKRSLPPTMLFISTVIRLLILPTRLETSPLFGDAIEDAFGAGVIDARVDGVGVTVPGAEAGFLPSDISDATRLIPLPSPLLPPSEVVALSEWGVEVLVMGVLALLLPVVGVICDFSTNLIRRECSNTS